MNRAKRSRLEAQGWRLGTPQDFLGLSEDEASYVEFKLRLAVFLRDLRRHHKLTQVTVATLLKSSQSRVAKMETGDPSVSVDLLLRSVLKLGAKVGLARANESLVQTVFAQFVMPEDGHPWRSVGTLTGKQ